MSEQPATTRPPTTTEQIKAGTLQNLHDAWLYDVAEQQRIMRAATSLGYGLDPSTYARPFPGTPAPQTFVAVEQARNRLGGLVMAAALAATGLGGAGLGGVLAAQLLTRQTPATSPAVTPPAASEVAPSEYEVIFESNGKQIEVEQK